MSDPLWKQFSSVLTFAASVVILVLLVPVVMFLSLLDSLCPRRHHRSYRYRPFRRWED